jgi:hypothetical protein
MENVMRSLLEFFIEALPYLVIIAVVFGIWRDRPTSIRGLYTVAFCGIYLAGIGRRTGTHWLLLVAAVSFAGAMALEIWQRKRTPDGVPGPRVGE